MSEVKRTKTIEVTVIKCDFCNEYFLRSWNMLTDKGIVPIHQFCSKSCFRAFGVRKKELLKKSRKANCKECGKEFIKTQGKLVFCSIECSSKFKTKNQNSVEKLKERKKRYHNKWYQSKRDNCPLCGAKKLIKSEMCYRCSKEYYKTNINNKSDLFDYICVKCGEPFVSEQRGRKYCSGLCRRRTVGLRNAHTHYKNRKIRGIKKVDPLAPWAWEESKCMVCGETRAIEQAHLFSEKRTEVTPLCRNHHWIWDRKGRLAGFTDLEKMSFLGNCMKVISASLMKDKVLEEFNCEMGIQADATA